MANEIPDPQPKLSAVEGHKSDSKFLRGTIALEMAAGRDHFGDADKSIIKFHGFYQQDDRDARKIRQKDGPAKQYIFMVRCKIPGGKVTAEQYLALDQLTDKYANGTLRITSRQGYQFHGVRMPGLKKIINEINQTLLTTLGACGDVNRNVMAPPAPFATPVYQQLQATADQLAAHFAPRTGAYHEIWLDGENVTPEPESVEPIYGKVYLPRKFKIGLALPKDNSVDVFAQDLGLLAIVKGTKIVGYNMLVGGGMGMTHGNPNTFPYIAQAICYVTPEQVRDGAEAVVKLFRDHGNRADRKIARIKYVVHKWGVDKFREVLATYLPFPLVLPKPADVTGFPLHLGWNEQGDGKFFYGLSVENGRIKDDGEFRLKTALRILVEKYRPRIRNTPMQDILLCDLPEGALPFIEQTLAEHGVSTQRSPVRQHSMACPAIPTCALAISEAERALPALIDQLEVALKVTGLAREKISIRMTGCPNGCVRTYQSDIGIVGRSGDKYTIFVGGNLVGSRLGFVLKDLVPLGDIVSTLQPILSKFRAERKKGEGFGDYCQRLGEGKTRELVGASANGSHG
jgi:sulfite reductase (ferredoxin)